MTHVSIDIDFFLSPITDLYYKEDLARSTLKKVEDMKHIPLIVKSEHQDILPYINKFKFDRIMNVDFHSDLVHDVQYEDDRSELDLNCGTWANFYKYRSTCQFVWKRSLYKVDNGLNLCDYYYRGLKKSEISYFDVKHRFGFSRFPKDTHSISVVLSEEYCDSSIYETVVSEFDWLYDGYKRGVK